MIKHYTPNILADAAEALLETQPLETISVQTIVDACGTTRTTFYRYFKDKYDIINWIYKRKADSIISSYIDSDTTKPMVIELLEYIKRSKQYYQSIMKYSGQNSFFDYFNDYGKAFYIARINHKTGQSSISTEMEMLVEGYCHGAAHLINEWISDNCSLSTEKLAGIICKLVPEAIAAYLY